MSQAGISSIADAGGGGIQTINGDVGFVTGSIISFQANVDEADQSGTPLFEGNDLTTMSLVLSDTNNNLCMGNLSGSVGNGMIGSFNSGYGYASLNAVTTGSYNSAFGWDSGISYIGAESSNILLRNTGVLGESHVMRLGTQGSGNGQVNQAFMAGVVGVTVSNAEYVTINSSTGQLGVAAIPAAGIVTINGDVGHVTGTTVTFTGDATHNGSSISFKAPMTSTMNLSLTDTHSNIILGSLAGNSSITGSSNGGYGASVFTALTSGSENYTVGGLISLTTGSFNASIGGGTLDITTGSYNFAGGYRAGNNYKGAESSNILISNTGVLGESNTMRLGTTGTGNGQVSTAYIAGVASITTSNSQYVTIDTTTGQLGSVAIPTPAVPLLQSTGIITLTSAQIKSMFATPIQVLAASGAGNIYVIVQSTLKLVYGGTSAFTGGGAIGLVDSGGQALSLTSNASNITGTANGYHSIAGQTGAPNLQTNIQNSPIFINNASGAFTGNAANDNTVLLNIVYYTLTM